MRKGENVVGSCLCAVMHVMCANVFIMHDVCHLNYVCFYLLSIIGVRYAAVNTQ